MINDEYIGSGRFTERSIISTNINLTIPKEVIKPGLNRITIMENLRSPDTCIPPREGDLWAVIRSESKIYIPLGVSEKEDGFTNLASYSELFGPTLNNMAFIVAPSDPVGKTIAMEFAYNLGIDAEGTIINPEFSFADNIPDQVLMERDLFVIGQPSKLPIISELSANMPAPFPSDSDIASEPQSGITFNLPTNTPTGYIEMFPSPWNSERMVLTLLGNDEQALKWTQNILLTSDLSDQLSGNLAIVYGENVYSSNTISIPSQDITVMAIVTPTPIETPPSNDVSQSNLIVIGVITAVMFLVAIVIIFLQRRRTLQK